MWRLPLSWFRNDWSKVAEVMAVCRGFQSLSFMMPRGKERVKQDDWCAPGVVVNPFIPTVPYSARIAGVVSLF